MYVCMYVCMYVYRRLGPDLVGGRLFLTRWARYRRPELHFENLIRAALLKRGSRVKGKGQEQGSRVRVKSKGHG